jgi:hypothetical protein
MREYTLIDAHGTAFVPQRDMSPDEVWVHGESGGEWVPWSIARQYPEDVTLDEILNDLQQEGEAA